MNQHDLLLLLVGSLIPNNVITWMYKRMKQFSKREHKNHIKLISPRRYYKLFETDPQTQYNYHRKMQKFWMFNFIPVIALLAIDIYGSLGHLSVQIESLILVVMLGLNTLFSLYANWDTETGDAHAAYASLRADEIQQAQAVRDAHPSELQIESTIKQVEEWSIG